MKPSFLFSLAIAFAFVSCGPSRYFLDLDMRQPSKAGVDLVGKNISVVYLENSKVNNLSFAKGLAEGFASSLEKEYHLEPGEVGLYKLPASSGSDYSSRDSMFNILMETGSDLVFLLDTVKLGDFTFGSPARVATPASPDSTHISSCTLPFSMKLYCYDGMNKVDMVKTFAGTSVASPIIYSDGTLSNAVLMTKIPTALLEEGIDVGKKVSVQFVPEWKTEQFSILCFDSQKWYNALEYARSFEWKEAMDIWMNFLNSNDPLKASSAAYNMAVACHILGNDALAKQWLDRSDALNPLPTNPTLRKRLR